MMMEWFYQVRDEVIKHLREGRTIEWTEKPNPLIKKPWRYVWRLVSQNPAIVDEQIWQGDELLLHERRRLNEHEVRNMLQVGWQFRVIE
jgi:hypothetical protein